MCTRVIVVIFEKFQLSLQVNRVPEQRLIKKLTMNGPDQALNEWERAVRIFSSPHNLQLRRHRLIQQINCLLEPSNSQFGWFD